MKLTRLFVVVTMVIVGTYLAGCCGGSKETVIVPVAPAAPAAAPSQPGTTLGQELQDLDEAYKKGAITKEEYDAAKKKMLQQK